MITIFCDFHQFSAKNGVFLKNQCYDPLYEEFSSVFSQKRQFFCADFFGEKFLKIATSVPEPVCSCAVPRNDSGQERAH
jgi:hypothetical protein